MEEYALQRVVGPSVEPISLAEARLHLRLDEDFTDDDLLIGTIVQGAREYCEEVLGQALVSQSWKLFMDRFPAWEIRIPRPPLISISHVKYLSPETGEMTTLDADRYDVDVASRPGRITPVRFGWWPAVAWHTNAVEVLFIAGEGGESSVPARVKLAMKLLVGHWYENREHVVTGTIATELQKSVDALLASAWSGSY